ncbi:phage major tail tube protein [Paenibacillus sp. GCM10012307]|uniref:Phage major tail tube protein n=1 Tax=Paenibacillus roseus TaxID=2798579 RepID=A0A934J888_9BACL|nr:phage major tail tube protein [Paenibacillus roseus]MBJ6362098.1 phage major tail tube protein [Paenibacillus roseus]
MPKRSERVIDYSVFLNGTEYLGTATADLPEINYLTDTIKGGGISGEVEAPAPGQTGPMTLTLNWSAIEEAAAKLMAPLVHAIDLRASIQSFDPAGNAFDEYPFKVTVRARPLGLSLGNLEPASTMDTTNTFSVTYIKVMIKNKEMLEIDKYNYVHKVNGVDYLAKTKANLGL